MSTNGVLNFVCSAQGFMIEFNFPFILIFGDKVTQDFDEAFTSNVPLVSI